MKHLFIILLLLVAGCSAPTETGEPVTESAEGLTLSTSSSEGLAFTNLCPNDNRTFYYHVIHYRPDLGDVSKWYSLPIPGHHLLYGIAGVTHCGPDGKMAPRPPSEFDYIRDDGTQRVYMATIPYPNIPNSSQRTGGWFYSRSKWSCASC